MNDNRKNSPPTRHIKDWKPYDQAAPTRRLSDLPSDPNVRRDGQDATVDPAAAGGGGVQADPYKTVLSDGSQFAKDAPADQNADFMEDPVVGWVVVVDGPGKGASLRLGYGMNPVGRADSNRVVLDFGDAKVSRERHCIITFEPKRGLYYIQNDIGQNLTYLDEESVLQPQELKSGQTIQVGDTFLRFVALCGPDFSWTAQS